LKDSLGQPRGRIELARTKIVAVRLVVLALLLAIAFAGAYERFAALCFLDW
jgi:hypothetical protein